MSSYSASYADTSAASSSNTINVGGNAYGASNQESLASAYKSKLLGTTTEAAPPNFLMLSGLGILAIAIIYTLVKKVK
jgi:hypothetical protein